MTEKRFALIIASYQYEDDKLRQLMAPPQDAKALAEVLSDPTIGGFEVQTILNVPKNIVEQKIEEFFGDRKRDDLLLLYFCGHGIKDADGKLYLTAPNTHRERLRSTAISAAFVSEVMRCSRSRQQVLILDCCFSGAFARGMVARADRTIGTKEQLGGRGRVLLTASDERQYAFEGDEITEERTIRGVFTHTLVHGLKTWEADMDRDGRISTDELYEYVFDRVTEKTPEQTPEMYALGVQGRIFIARKPRAHSLPKWVVQALTSSNFNARLAAVVELRRILESPNRILADRAYAELERLSREDHSPIVRGAAAGAIKDFPLAMPAKVPARVRPPAELKETSNLDKSIKLGNTEWIKGNLPKALIYFSEALKQAESVGDFERSGICLGNIGSIYRIEGDLDIALKYLEDALKIHRDIGDRLNEGIDLGDIGLIYLDKGKYTEAIECFEKATELNPEYEGSWYGKGVALMELGKYVEAIECFEKATELNPEYEEVLSDQSKQILVQEYLGAVDLGAAETVELSIEALEDRNLYIRRAAAKVLGEIGDPRAVEPLIEALRGENWDTKWVVRALERIGEAATEPLIQSLKDKNLDVRRAAAKVLGKIGDPKAVEPLIKALEDKDWYVRRAAARALGEIGDKRAAKPLIRSLRDKDLDIRRAAANALKEIGRKAIHEAGGSPP